MYLTRVMYMFARGFHIAYTCKCICLHVDCIMLTRVMCYATNVCSTRVVLIGLCVHSFGRGFLPMYESREVSTLTCEEVFAMIANDDSEIPAS